jgi:hypothetical protein
MAGHHAEGVKNGAKYLSSPKRANPNKLKEIELAWYLPQTTKIETGQAKAKT